MTLQAAFGLDIDPAHLAFKDQAFIERSGARLGLEQYSSSDTD